MTRALIWSLIGSAATVAAIGGLMAGVAWAAPAVRIHKSSERSVQLLGHRLTARLEIAVDQPLLSVTQTDRRTGAFLLTGAAGSQLSCVALP